MRMNKIRTNREFIFNLYLYFNPRVMEDLIKYNIEDLKLEKNFYGRKIDIFGNSGEKEVYIETQITKGDEMHLKQIKFIIDNVDNSSDTLIIWIAQGFQELMIDNIEEYIRDSRKNIEFMAIDLISGVDEMLETLGEFGEFGIIENLWRLDNIINLEVVGKYFRKSSMNLFNISIIKDEKLTEKEIIMEEILVEMREKLFYVPTIHREKKFAGNTIVLGSGYGEINFIICLNRFNKLTIALTFNQNTKEVFNKILEGKNDLEEFMDFVIEWDYNLFKIYSEQTYEGNKDRVIRQQVRVLEKLINYFTTFMDSIELMEELA